MLALCDYWTCWLGSPVTGYESVTIAAQTVVLVRGLCLRPITRRVQRGMQGEVGWESVMRSGQRRGRSGASCGAPRAPNRNGVRQFPRTLVGLGDGNWSVLGLPGAPLYQQEDDRRGGSSNEQSEKKPRHGEPASDPSLSARGTWAGHGSGRGCRFVGEFELVSLAEVRPFDEGSGRMKLVPTDDGLWAIAACTLRAVRIQVLLDALAGKHKGRSLARASSPGLPAPITICTSRHGRLRGWKAMTDRLIRIRRKHLSAGACPGAERFRKLRRNCLSQH